MSYHAGEDYDNWTKYALCNGLETEYWFRDSVSMSTMALRVCMDCPVRVQCIFDNLSEERGVWGGLTQYNRNFLRRAIHSDKFSLEDYLRGIDYKILKAYDKTVGLPIKKLFSVLSGDEIL